MLAAGPFQLGLNLPLCLCVCSLRALPSTNISLFRETFFHLVGLCLGTHCRGACEAGLNWRPANLACRPLNLAHLVE